MPSAWHTLSMQNISVPSLREFSSLKEKIFVFFKMQLDHCKEQILSSKVDSSFFRAKYILILNKCFLIANYFY